MWDLWPNANLAVLLIVGNNIKCFGGIVVVFVYPIVIWSLFKVSVKMLTSRHQNHESSLSL